MKISKNRYLTLFAIIVAVLAVVRLLFPGVAAPRHASVDREAAQEVEEKEPVPEHDAVAEEPPVVAPERTVVAADAHGPVFFDAEGRPVRRRILSVPSYKEAFPDSNYVQIASAREWGVSPVQDRNEAEHRKQELVFVGASPFYHVDPMRQSIPYLVPRAAVLLHDIGRNFFDSLQVKGVPLHRFIVTSVLRTKDDVAKLRNYNKNATENSCYLYGTTFDISYNRYVTVQPPGEHRRQVGNDTLKWVLTEVLNDMRNNRRCHIKYEVKQGCFHITTR